MSEQPIAPIRQSNFSDAVTIGALNTKLTEANAELAKWKISILADVVSTDEGFGVKLNVFNGNEQGFIKNIGTVDVLYYANDPAVIIDQIVADVHEHLLKTQIRNTVGPLVTKALRNAGQRQNVKLGIKS
jgi:hypothetical protein